MGWIYCQRSPCSSSKTHAERRGGGKGDRGEGETGDEKEGKAARLTPQSGTCTDLDIHVAGVHVETLMRHLH